MSALGRLLARAGGQAASGLRPRLPGRFEAPARDADAGFEILTQTEPAAPPTYDAEAPARAERQSTPPPDLLDQQKQVARTSNPLESEIPETASRTAPRAEVASPPAPLQPEPSIARPSVAPTNPDQPGVSNKPPPQAASDPPPDLKTPVVITQPRAQSPLGPLPDRLQPPSPQSAELPPHLTPPASATRPAPARRTPVPATPPEPPEITVHIGRIHVAADTPKTTTPRPVNDRPQRPRSASNLRDYLRGKGGSG